MSSDIGSDIGSDLSTEMSSPTTGRSPANLAYTPTGRLTGTVALVTGAAGNLGSVIVRHFLREGAVVVPSGRTRSKLDAVR